MSEQAACGPPSSFLAVGLSLQLSLAQDEAGAQYGSSLLGWQEGRWLMCEWPFHLGAPIPCRPGTACLIRYIYEGKMIGYRSEVVNTQMQPFPFLLLAFPVSIDEVVLRKHSRVSANEPVVLSCRNDGWPTSDSASATRIGGLLVDVSASGCAVVLQRPIQDFAPGMLVWIEFELVGIGHVGNLAGVVRNLARQKGGTQLGLEFRFDGKETIEYRGWGGSVRNALESFVLQKHSFESA